MRCKYGLFGRTIDVSIMLRRFNLFTPANCSRTDITDPAHTKCVLKMNTFV